jgi:hypothetical protein
MFQLNRNKQMTNRNNLIESIFWYFYEDLVLFRFVSKQFCWFQLFQYRFETPKQTKIFCFLVSQNKPKHNRNRSFFGLFRFESIFVLFRGHPSYTFWPVVGVWPDRFCPDKISLDWF